MKYKTDKESILQSRPIRLLAGIFRPWYPLLTYGCYPAENRHSRVVQALLQKNLSHLRLV